MLRTRSRPALGSQAAPIGADPASGAEPTAPRQRQALPILTGTHHRLNDRLGVALIGLVAIAPLPLGSNRPIFWSISAVAVAILAGVYWLRVAALRQGLRYPLRRIAPEILLFGLCCGYLLLQVLPLGALFEAYHALAPRIGDLDADALSLAPGATLFMLLRMLTYGLFFTLMLQVSVNPRRSRMMITGLFVTTVAYAVLGLFLLTQLNDTIFGLEKWAYPGSATATFVNRNSYATFLAMGMVLGSVVLLQALARRAGLEVDVLYRHRGLRIAAVLLGLVFIVAALLATQSRLGLLVGALGSAAIFILGARRAGLGRRTTAALMLGTAVAIVVIGANLNGVFDRALSAGDSGDVRLALYRQVIGMISERPLLGYGGGSFDVVFPLFHRPPVNTDLVWEKAHSSYLELWVELGIVAGSIPLAVVVVLFGRAVAGYLRVGRNWQPGLACIGIVVVAAVHSIADFSLEIQAVTFLFLAVLAIGVASRTSGRSP